MLFKLLPAVLLATVAVVSAPAHAVVTVSIEAPGVQSSTQANIGGVESFTTAANGFTTTSFGGAPISGTVTSGFFNVSDANQYGGAGGSGKFATVAGTTSLALSAPTNYFGLWASAIDGNNTVALFSKGVSLGNFSLKSLSDALPNAGSYNGNPSAPYAGNNANERYAFFNFSSTTAFDRVDLVQNGGGGFELDNLTVGKVAAVPESATWAMTLVGFGAIGGTMRSRKRTLAAA